MYFMRRLLYLIIGVIFLVILYDINKRLRICYDSNIRVFYVSNTVNSIRSKPKTIVLKDFAKQERNQYDYEDIIYPIPFSQLVHDYSYKYVDFSLPSSILPSYVLTGYLPESNTKFSDILVTTAASDNHGYGSFNLLYSILLADPYSSILYIDLGLSEKLLNNLKCHFETLHQIQMKMNSNGILAYRKLNWDSFPDWMNLFHHPLQKGGYSWKVIPYIDAFFEWKGLFSFLDAGDLIVDGFSREFTLARRYGFFAPSSPGTIADWTYPDTIEFMKQNGLVHDVKDTDPNCSSGIIFIDYSKEYTHELMRKFEACAYTQKCISPKGSSRYNHRQDQAVLSMLLNEYKVPMAMKKNFHPALRNEKPKLQVLKNLVIAIQETYHIHINNSLYNFSSFEYKATKLHYTSRKLDY